MRTPQPPLAIGLCLLLSGLLIPRSGFAAMTCQEAFTEINRPRIHEKSPRIYDNEILVINQHLQSGAEVGVWYALGWDGKVLASSDPFSSGRKNGIGGSVINRAFWQMFNHIQQDQIDARQIREIIMTHIHPKGLMSGEFSDADWRLFRSYQKYIKIRLPPLYQFPMRGVIIFPKWRGFMTRSTDVLPPK